MLNGGDRCVRVRGKREVNGIALGVTFLGVCARAAR